ncbi:hypothetical protein N7447_010174 [Penicillium robsamsonii]|uniref:uncharacterized protein n=1 Tax=Penicillium robsamsonii TaxID=1792511 RepID=UPI0025494343|nr:uncharacterized protein N7447_010174 [Penicillium robsamsonii]KAJ5813151.1 hypothetical protein N7447_010174 [Penicillium robsamsonii]
MKGFMAISSVLAFIGLAIWQTQTTCTADDVFNSITAVQHYAAEMHALSMRPQRIRDSTAGLPLRGRWTRILRAKWTWKKAVKMHGYILQAQQGSEAIQSYTAEVKEAALSCAGRIDTAYVPLGEQLQTLLQAYPDTA